MKHGGSNLFKKELGRKLRREKEQTWKKNTVGKKQIK